MVRYKGLDPLRQHRFVREIDNAQPLSLQEAKPRFHLVHPGAVYRRIVPDKPAMPRQSFLNLLARMHGHIVQHADTIAEERIKCAYSLTLRNWVGGFYELGIELGPRSEVRLEAVLLALWQNARLAGCYVRRDLDPVDQQRVEPSLDSLERYGHLLSVATVPNGRTVACGMFAIREEGGSDWLDFYLPMAALSTVYEVGAFPFDDGKDSTMWREPLDVWLVKLAHAVFSVVPFSLALIGYEVSGRAYATEIAISGIPTQRWDGYLRQEAGKLRWYPPIVYSAVFTVDH